LLGKELLEERVGHGGMITNVLEKFRFMQDVLER
jgi:hypothetical protein